jgi:hypothetical protein
MKERCKPGTHKYKLKEVCDCGEVDKVHPYNVPKYPKRK